MPSRAPRACTIARRHPAPTSPSRPSGWPRSDRLESAVANRCRDFRSSDRGAPSDVMSDCHDGWALSVAGRRRTHDARRRRVTRWPAYRILGVPNRRLGAVRRSSATSGATRWCWDPAATIEADLPIREVIELTRTCYRSMTVAQADHRGACTLAVGLIGVDGLADGVRRPTAGGCACRSTGRSADRPDARPRRRSADARSMRQRTRRLDGSSRCAMAANARAGSLAAVIC